MFSKNQLLKKELVFIMIMLINFCFSQSNKVTIIANIPQLHGGEYISFSKPIGEFTTTSFYVDNQDNAVIKDNRFIKTIDITNPGIIYVYEKPYNLNISCRFFAEPGDTIIIDKVNQEFIFKGNNAVVNKLYSDVKLAPKAFNNEIYNIFKDNSDNVLLQINDKLKEHVDYYYELFLNKQISKSCFEFTRILIEHSIDGLALNIALDKKFREEQKMLITQAEANKIVNEVSLKYIDYNKENLKSPFFLGLIRKTALYQEKKMLNEKKKIIRFWNQFDKIFKSKIDNIGVIDFIDYEDYRETSIGQYFLDLIRDYDKEKSIKFQDLVTVYSAFVEKFPNSAYIIPISKSIISKASEHLNTNVLNTLEPDSKELLGKLVNYEKNLELVNNDLFANSNQSLESAFIEKFPSQDILIDFWATWCGPCIKQFEYNNDLKAFLETKNIKILYLSVDKEDEVSKWEKYIHDYKLTGLHYLGNKSYQEKHINPLGSTIPMYLLFNSKTKKLVKIEGFPSEKGKFYANVIKGLSAK